MAFDPFTLEDMQSDIVICSFQRRGQFNRLANVTFSKNMKEQKGTGIWRSSMIRPVPSPLTAFSAIDPRLSESSDSALCCDTHGVPS
ncbi:hypothetical protein N7457_000397 [Penicillium paradoxum]|uniref:uncharacterized protein n=1 Tax=Penicillium paradoxum TaxID=176176 RepID=UPI002546E577|nr:uncharacterized protein N7457_000397 [Penicillium paradoxum]KAJ5793798.1 hypothetical protein N7457_000397 [Penicillium paradoxum]